MNLRNTVKGRNSSVTGIKLAVSELERSTRPRTVQDLRSVEGRRSHSDADSERTLETKANGGNVNVIFDFFLEKEWVSISTSLLL